MILLLGGSWVVNLIWFKPLNIRHFYDRLFIEFALQNPELVTQLGVPVLYDMSKDELADVSDQAQWDEFNKLKSDFEMLQSYDFEGQSAANQLNTKILSHFLGSQLDGESFFYHDYPVNQMFGVQSQLPSMMESSHKLRNDSDVEAYITRLSKFDEKFDHYL